MKPNDGDDRNCVGFRFGNDDHVKRAHTEPIIGRNPFQVPAARFGQLNHGLINCRRRFYR